MKRLLFLALLITSHLSLLTASAQPGWAKKASKSVFTLKTFDEKGTLLASATGFYVGTDGEAFSCFAPFKGASRALVIDAAGKEHAVSYMLGANETYDVARFRVEGGKTQPLGVAPSMAQTQASVWLLPFRETKNVPHGIITKTETFQEHYGYYTVALAMPEGAAGAPLLNDEGAVVAIMQQPYGQDTLSYAVSARFADSLRISGLSINDPVLRSTRIKKALPDDVAQAQLTLYMASAQMDSAAYAALVDDFIGKFPTAHEGYVTRAQLAADNNHCDQADRDMALALKVADNPDEVHYSFSRMIYQKALSGAQDGLGGWTMERALEEAQAAYSQNPQPVYLHQQAIVAFAQKRYDDAYQLYQKISNTPLRSAEMFYEAALCKKLAGDTVTHLALLDSCVAQLSRPLLKEAAPCLLACAQDKMSVGRNREAVTLLNDYEQLMAAQVNDQFYYLRFTAELDGKLYQQALNDITKAISISPANEIYHAEKASLQVRVGLYDDAIETAMGCIGVAPDSSNGYLFLGLAQCLKGQKDEGVKNLMKARELGDPQADELIEKYSKE